MSLRPSPIIAAFAVAGCTAYAPTAVKPGDSALDVARAMGEPTAVHPLAHGASRLEYARGPYGKHTYMIELDAGGRVVGWQQVLTEAGFNGIATGMKGDQLRREFGRPSETRHGGWPGGQVWSYRYDAGLCQWFQVSLDDAGLVTGTAYATDPHCDAGDARTPNP